MIKYSKKGKSRLTVYKDMLHKNYIYLEVTQWTKRISVIFVSYIIMVRVKVHTPYRNIIH